jgi:hypothetical protein
MPTRELLEFSETSSAGQQRTVSGTSGREERWSTAEVAKLFKCDQTTRAQISIASHRVRTAAWRASQWNLPRRPNEKYQVWVMICAESFKRRFGVLQNGSYRLHNQIKDQTKYQVEPEVRRSNGDCEKDKSQRCKWVKNHWQCCHPLSTSTERWTRKHSIWKTQRRNAGSGNALKNIITEFGALPVLVRVQSIKIPVRQTIHICEMHHGNSIQLATSSVWIVVGFVRQPSLCFDNLLLRRIHVLRRLERQSRRHKSSLRLEIAWFIVNGWYVKNQNPCALLKVSHGTVIGSRIGVWRDWWFWNQGTNRRKETQIMRRNDSPMIQSWLLNAIVKLVSSDSPRNRGADSILPLSSNRHCPSD